MQKEEQKYFPTKKNIDNPVEAKSKFYSKHLKKHIFQKVNNDNKI